MSNPRHNYNQKIKGDQRVNSNYQNRGPPFNAMQNTSAKTTMHSIPNNHITPQPQQHNPHIPTQHHQHYPQHPHINHMSHVNPLNHQMNQMPATNFNQQNRQIMPRMPNNNRNFPRGANAQQMNYLIQDPNQPAAMVFQQPFSMYPSNVMVSGTPLYYNTMIPPFPQPQNLARMNLQPSHPPTSMPSEVQIQNQLPIDNSIKVPNNPPLSLANQVPPVVTSYTAPQPKVPKKASTGIIIQDPKTLREVDVFSLANTPIDKNSTTTTENENVPLTNQKNQQVNIISDNHDPVANKQQIKQQNDQNKSESSKRNEDKNENLMTNSLTTKNVVTTKDVNVEKQALKKNNETQMTDKSNQQSDLQKDGNLEAHKLVDQQVELQMDQIQLSSNISTPNPIVKQENISPVIDNKTALTSNEPIVQKERSKDDNQMLNTVGEKLDKLKLTDSTQDKKLVLNNKQDNEQKTDKKQIETKPVDINKDKNVELKQQATNLSNDSKFSLSDKSNVEEQKIQQQRPAPIKPQPQQSSQQTTQSQTTNLIKSQSSVSQVQPKVATKTPITNEEPKKSNSESVQSKISPKMPLSYDVNFLKEMQDARASTQRPDFANLHGKGVEIFLPNARSKHETQLVLNCGNNDLDPHYFRQGNPNLYGRHSNSTQLGPRMNPEIKGPRKILSNSLNQEVKLRQAENAWKPDRDRINEESVEALIKKARGMLNKLTPQNFIKISQQFLTLKIDNPEKLRKMIELIFDKAVDEPAFCEQYASLCDTMSHLTVTNPQSDTKIKFNTLLLERCQTCFETADKYQDINVKEREEQIANCQDPEKKQQLIDELDEEKRLIRKKSLGNIKLIGALYKNKRLKDEIMDLCIDTLIKNDDEDSYECLCSLLKSIGEKFENNTKNKNKFIGQMKQLEQVVRANKIASRIKFLIMDVLDMRKEGWKLRKLQDVNKPKTIEEVHLEAKRLEEQSNREINNMGKRNDSMRKSTNNNWLNSHQRKSQNSSEAIANLRKMTEQRLTETPSFGPPSFNAPKNMNVWSSGASGAKQSSMSSDKKNINQWQNRNNNSNSNQLGDYNKASTSLVKKNPFRGTCKADNEQTLFSMIESYKKLIQEYVKTESLDTLIDSIYDISTEESVHIFVISAIDCACESMLKKLNEIGDLLCKLVIDKKVITYQQFHKGLKHHLDTSEDVITDVPKLFEYIGQILSHFYFKIPDEDRRSFFKNALEPCLQWNTSIKILAHLIQNLIKENDLAEVVQKWSVSKMSLEDFSKKPEDEIKEFLINEFNLRNFITQLSNCKVSSGSSDRSDLCSQIINDAKLNDIPKLINQGLSSNNTNAKKLICALFERCIKDAIEFDRNSGNCTFQYKRFNDMMKNMPPIKELNEIDVQVEIIYMITRLIDQQYQNPKDFTTSLFFELYTNKYLQKSALLKWFEEGDKMRSGNSIALLSSKRFIQDLEDED